MHRDLTGSRSLHPTGYRSREYAEAFRAHGTPIELERAGLWVLERQIAQTTATDVMGLYPMMVCNEFTDLAVDLSELKMRAVSFVAVTDPFEATPFEDMGRIFDSCEPFKDHYLTDLSQPIESFVASKRLNQAARAEESFEISVEDAAVSDETIAECWKLYDDTMARVGATGIRRFDYDSFEAMMRVPGTVCFVARTTGGAIAMQIDYRDGDFVYAHLAASDDEGRRLGAAAAINIRQIRHYQGDAGWIDSGSAPGNAADSTHGLARFKRAFSNRIEPVYLCSTTFDPERYAQLSRGIDADYFPAYRATEAD